MTLEQICELRAAEDGTTYYDFIEYFVSAVVGKKKYKENKCEMLLSQYASKSDEAFAILLFDNNIDVWLDMAKKGITKNSDVKPKYTNGGSATGETASSRVYEGWSRIGLTKFNTIFDMVKKDRKEPHARKFEEEFRQHCETTLSGNKRKVPEFEHDAIDIRHELWSDDEDGPEGPQQRSPGADDFSNYVSTQKRWKEDNGNSAGVYDAPSADQFDSDDDECPVPSDRECV